jgi:hypothetical protein
MPDTIMLDQAYELFAFECVEGQSGIPNIYEPALEPKLCYYCHEHEVATKPKETPICVACKERYANKTLG